MILASLERSSHSDNSWVHKDDMCRIAPNLLDGYLQANSPEANFSTPRRDDGIINTYFKSTYKNNN